MSFYCVCFYYQRTFHCIGHWVVQHSSSAVGRVSKSIFNWTQAFLGLWEAHLFSDASTDATTDRQSVPLWTLTQRTFIGVALNTL